LSRGPWRFSFTYADIAAAACVSTAVAKRARNAGEYNVASLTSVMEWCAKRREVALARQLRAARKA